MARWNVPTSALMAFNLPTSRREYRREVRYASAVRFPDFFGRFGFLWRS